MMVLTSEDVDYIKRDAESVLNTALLGFLLGSYALKHEEEPMEWLVTLKNNLKQTDLSPKFDREVSLEFVKQYNAYKDAVFSVSESLVEGRFMD